MQSACYTKVVDLVSQYTGAEKGPGLVERQLKYCTAAPSGFGIDDLRKIVNYLTAASKLYMLDKAKGQELADRLKAMAA